MCCGRGFDSLRLHHFKDIMRKQKGRPGEYPFTGWTVYGPRFHEIENRNYVVLYNKDSKQRKCISYARYLMSIKLQRFLLKSEEVDHKDNNKSNDDIENLQILTSLENAKKAANVKGVRFGKFLCPQCSVVFERRIGLSHIQQKTKLADFCTRSCRMKHSYSGNTNLKTNLIEEFRRHD